MVYSESRSIPPVSKKRDSLLLFQIAFQRTDERLWSLLFGFVSSLMWGSVLLW